MSFKVAISYPPLESVKGSALLSQNRQFQWTNTGNFIYPVIPAYAATLLASSGFDVFWDDAIAQKLNFQSWFSRLKSQKPDLIFIETKTPVIKKHWQIINRIKKATGNGWRPVIVLGGDHVTALPEESLRHSKADYILTGGDYDFMLLSLVRHLVNGDKLEPGFYYHSKGKIINSGPFALKHHNLDDLPIIDRQLTQWRLYATANSNYKYKPGAYIMSGRDCWWGQCRFCSWTTLYPGRQYRHFSVGHTIAEIKNLAKLGVREIFDDSGTLPVGKWLEDLCHRLIDTGLNRKIRFSCNLRFNSLTPAQYQLLGKAGFRFILYGLESADPDTLKRINKNIKISHIRQELSAAKAAGLEPHITIMIGYPWEDLSAAQKTLHLARSLFKAGLIDSLQATRIIPYPGTPLFSECQRKGLLLTTDWNKYDMRRPIMKSPLSAATQTQLIRELFKGVFTPQFLWRKVTSIRSFDDFRFLANYGIKFILKLKDFYVKS